MFSNCFIGFFERTRLLLAVAVSIGATEGTLLSGTSVVAFVLGWYLAGGRLTTVLPSLVHTTRVNRIRGVLFGRAIDKPGTIVDPQHVDDILLLYLTEISDWFT